jgi:hypothetical protein
MAHLAVAAPTSLQKELHRVPLMHKLMHVLGKQSLIQVAVWGDGGVHGTPDEERSAAVPATKRDASNEHALESTQQCDERHCAGD